MLYFGALFGAFPFIILIVLLVRKEFIGKLKMLFYGDKAVILNIIGVDRRKRRYIAKIGGKTKTSTLSIGGKTFTVDPKNTLLESKTPSYEFYENGTPITPTGAEKQKINPAVIDSLIEEALSMGMSFFLKEWKIVKYIIFGIGGIVLLILLWQFQTTSMLDTLGTHLGVNFG